MTSTTVERREQIAAFFTAHATRLHNSVCSSAHAPEPRDRGRLPKRVGDPAAPPRRHARRAQIARLTDSTYTAVNCRLSEGRAALRRAIAASDEPLRGD